MVLVRSYLDAPHAQVRLAALAGLQRLGDTTLPQQVVAMLDDPEVQVQAAALALVLAAPGGPAYAQAQRQWEAMLDAPAIRRPTRRPVGVSQCPGDPVAGTPLPCARSRRHRRALCCPPGTSCPGQARRLTSVDAALLQVLEAEEVEVRSGPCRCSSRSALTRPSPTSWCSSMTSSPRYETPSPEHSRCLGNALWHRCLRVCAHPRSPCSPKKAP